MKRSAAVTSALGESEHAAKATFALLRRYVLQETVTPLKHLAKRALFASVGALLSGVGAVIVLIGILRVLQTETGGAMRGNWSFAPYLLTAVVALAVIGIVAAGALRQPSAKKRPRPEE